MSWFEGSGRPALGHGLRGAAARARARAIVRLSIGLALSGALAACGFHLRGDASYPFSTLYINSPTATPLAGELRRALDGGSLKLVDTSANGEAILDILGVADDKQVLSLTGGGRVREYQLTKRVTFALHDAKGRDWAAAGEIVVRRSFSFNESEVLAREFQEARLLKEMQTDAVQQIVRRLRTASKPA